MIPLRLGLVLVSSNPTNADNKLLVSSIVRLLVSAKKKYGTSKANRFLIELSKQKIFPMGLNHVLAAYGRGMKAATGSWSDSSFVTEAQDVLEDETAYIEVAEKIQEFIEKKGLPLNSYVINGKLYDSLSKNVMQDLMQDVFREQQMLGQLVQVGVITKKSNVYGFFTGTVKKKKSKINSEFAFLRYDSRILNEKNIEYVPLVVPPTKGSGSGDESGDGSTQSGQSGHQGGHHGGHHGKVESRDVLLNPKLQMSLPYFRLKLAAEEDVEKNKENAQDEKKKKTKKTKTKLNKSLHHDVPVTHWVVADFCTSPGVNLLASAVQHYTNTRKRSENTIRIAALHRGDLRCLREIDASLIPTDVTNSIKGSPLADIQHSLLNILPKDVSTNMPCLITNGRLIRVGTTATFDTVSFQLLEKFERSRYTSDIYKILKKEKKNEKKKNKQKDSKEQSSSSSSDYEVIMRSNSLVAQYALQTREPPVIKPSKAKQYFDSVSYTYTGREDMNVIAIIDPLSVSAQRMTPTLLMLRDVFNMTVTVFLHPNTDIQEFPLKNFYRFVPTTVVTQETAQKEKEKKDRINAKIKKKSKRMVKPKNVKEGEKIKNVNNNQNIQTKEQPSNKPVLWGSKDKATTKFVKLPKQHVLTLKLVTPESWVAMKYKVEDDLDNIRLDDQTMGTRRNVQAEFRLTSLLVAGNCEDLTHYKPPNGLQLVLKDVANDAASGATSATSDASNNIVTDTLVMQNLGYYQLKTQPGSFTVSLADGRANELYTIVDESNEENHPKESRGVDVSVRSFADVRTSFSVRKRPGMENVQLLDTLPTNEDGSTDVSTGEDEGMWGKITNIWSTDSNTGGADTSKKYDKDTGEEILDTIHVFSLASGHLYERLLRIMMSSVTKRTSGTVKFWLVENFLSPQFKKTISAVAKELGCEVGLVTYKWPAWLRRQTEKQRIIWGYKILFLDVLFPLSVPKIITVDADQVVRADLRELWNMDLKGHAYAYTPFCTSRKETLGYQFWRKGYWNEHLQGKPYHISALYVVDLVRFRRMAAGDTLRAVYDQLSRDPNSLSNLDQDLPNYVQHQIPIYSLPTEWLWCASWCSDETKKDSKTIDLCNHPETKEPKLEMAKRIISGPLFKESWIELDDEIATIMKNIKKGTKKSGRRSSVRVLKNGKDGAGGSSMMKDEL